MIELLIFIAILSWPFIIFYPLYAPMPKWRQRQLERKKPMKERIIDIDVEKLD